jgi:uncharacterized protein (TIGR00730 family)
MKNTKRYTVFCGSSAGNEAIYAEQATALGKALVQRNIGLVFGGGKIGMMGAVADAVMTSGGEAIGVIPKFLCSKEIAHANLSKLIIVDTMHERKMTMNELCQGVITLPGGFGTMEELFEMLTWQQLGLHQKPIGLLNTNGFYDDLLAMVQTMVNKGYLPVQHQNILLADSSIDGLLDKMENFVAPEVPKWITEDEV